MVTSNPTTAQKPDTYKPVRNIVVACLYMAVASIIVQDFVFPRLTVGYWAGATVQIVFYLIVGAPFIYLMRGHIARLFQATSWQIAIGLVLVVGAIAYAYIDEAKTASEIASNIVRQIFTVPIEELIFRGYIYAQSLLLTKNNVYVALINVVAFTSIHIPYVIEQNKGIGILVGAAALGLTTVVLRQKTGNLVLGSSVHAVLNIV